MAPRSRLLVFAVLLPAVVAGTNQLALEAASTFSWSLRPWLLYLWMVFTTAVLSWCTGRYLQPAWLRWVVFGWCLSLLDFLTIAACLGGPLERHFGYVLVSTQIGLIVLWGVLATASWQWRMPVVLAMTSTVIVFSGSFDEAWGGPNWSLLMLLSSTVLLLQCGLLRISAFLLQRPISDAPSLIEHQAMQSNQFGLKHVLIWMTALVPILLVIRGLDFIVLKRIGGPDLFSVTLVAIIVATVNLIAIWSVLGRGHWFLRLIALVVTPFLVASGMSRYLENVESTYRVTRGFGPWSVTSFNNTWYNSLVCGIAEERDSLVSWLWLNAALLAALLLFLRASGYRLMKTDH
jgi:hypothetical protein